MCKSCTVFLLQGKLTVLTIFVLKEKKVVSKMHPPGTSSFCQETPDLIQFSLAVYPALKWIVKNNLLLGFHFHIIAFYSQIVVFIFPPPTPEQQKSLSISQHSKVKEH